MNLWYYICFRLCPNEIMRPMNKVFRLTSILLLATVVLSSCATKRPFTDEIRKEYNMTDDVLKKIQFFTSEDITLYRASSESGVEIVNGEVVLSSANTEDRIVIPRGTKGVFEKSMGSSKVAIRFELGDGRFLVFGGEGNYQGRYQLMAEEWVNKHGKLTYSGEKWFATPDSGRAYLLFKLKKLNKYKKESRVVGGLDVD